MFILITDVVIVVERLTVRVDQRTSSVYRVAPCIASIHRRRPIVTSTTGRRIHRRAVRPASNAVQRVVFTRMIVIHIEIVLLTWRPLLGAVGDVSFNTGGSHMSPRALKSSLAVASSNTSGHNVKSQSSKGRSTSPTDPP